MDLKKLYGVFVEEALELVSQLEDGLLHLEKSPDDKDILDTIFRAAHTVKGSSGSVGLKGISVFTHSMEELMDQVRQGKARVDHNLVNVLLESTDLIKAMVESVSSGTDFDFGSCDAVVARMEALKNPRPQKEKHEKSEPRQYRITFVPAPNLLLRGMDPLIVLEDLAALGEVKSIEASDDKVPPLSSFSAEELYLSWSILLETGKNRDEIQQVFQFVEDGSTIEIRSALMSEEETTFIGNMLIEAGAVKEEDVEEALRKRKRLGEILIEEGKVSREDVEKALAKQNERKVETFAKSVSSTIRVDLHKLDHLINIVGEMVIILSMFQQALYSGENGGQSGLSERLDALFAQLQRIGRDIQESSMALRMLPVGEVFNRFSRLVRELSISKNKTIELLINGEDTELDKGVLEKITDPLVHLLRNSIDHGIETPAERMAAGKPEHGTITLSAYQLGDAVFIDIADDGRGLDRQKILAKAREKGLVQEEDVLTDDQVMQLIFVAGFSTADAVTDISGRGVGMDVVKKNIDALNGKIAIRTSPGMGTTISIKLPLTLAIIDGLTVSVGKDIFVVPLMSVIESLRPRREDVKTVSEKGEVVNVRGEFIPLVRLYERLGIEPVKVNPWEAIVILVSYEKRKCCLLVDDLLGQQQVVIKNLGSAIPKVSDIAGGTILGDGKVALVIDISGIVEHAIVT